MLSSNQLELEILRSQNGIIKKVSLCKPFDSLSQLIAPQEETFLLPCADNTGTYDKSAELLVGTAGSEHSAQVSSLFLPVPAMLINERHN